MHKKIALCLSYALFLGLLTSCGPNGNLHLKKDESSLSSNSKTEPGNATENANTPAENTNSAVDPESKIGAPVALPPSFSDTSPPDQAGNTPNGFPAMQPMKGVNVDDLFAENIRDEDKRFERLEDAVLQMRKEFESVKPSIVRLAAVETDIQSLVKEMDAMLQETPTQMDGTLPPDEASLQIEQLDPQPAVPPEAVTENTPLPEPAAPATQSAELLSAPPLPMGSTPVELPADIQNSGQQPKYVLTSPTGDASKKPQALTAQEPKAAPAPSEPKKQAKQVQAAKSYDGIVAQELRIGEHDDKIRIVIDANKKTAHTLDLDNEEKLIIVEMPDAKWVGAMTKSFPDSQLVESYNVEPMNDGKGSMIVITLRRQTSVLKDSFLTPDGGQGHRIYFDLKL